jgi:hypothetical protein
VRHRLKLVLALLLLSGCRAGLDAVAQHTGTGVDPEGLVHAFLWARHDGRDTSWFWASPAAGQPAAEDPVEGRPMRWRVVPRAQPSEGWRQPWTTWKRFAVTSRLPDGRDVERAWDFCVDGVLDREPRFAIYEAWPAARDTFYRCSLTPSSARYGGRHAGELVYEETMARRIRERGPRLVGRTIKPLVECGLACGVDGTDNDCDLCVCRQYNGTTPACAAIEALEF